jgi:hypothetical protein
VRDVGFERGGELQAISARRGDGFVGFGRGGRRVGAWFGVRRIALQQGNRLMLADVCTIVDEGPIRAGGLGAVQGRVSAGQERAGVVVRLSLGEAATNGGV